MNLGILAATTSPLLPYLRTVTLTQVLFYACALIAFVWIIYTIVLMYHWFRYSHQSRFSATIFAVHLFVSVLLGVYAVSGFIL